ncbi:MAG: rhodanese-like domain-containing protein [Halofilum sp. (in: g-proteobacteria)]
MFFREILNEDLGCASYIVADGGRAAVVDPKWEIDAYLDIARDHGFRLTDIIETHNHADHVSGHGRLSAATGATVHVARAAEVAYEHRPLGEGDAIELGQVRIVALATPGHRPEHLSFLVEDRSRAPSPWVLFSGDFLFVGDMARPDLALEPTEGARDIFQSLARLQELPDYVEVRPAHVGGSLCGGSGMSRKPDSTLGFERQYNAYLNIRDESEFVTALTSDETPQPPNVAHIVGLNRGPLLTEAVTARALLAAHVHELVIPGHAVLIDGRDQREFDGAHAPGAINITMNQSGVGTRAAWMVDPEAMVVTMADGDEHARAMIRMLEAVGFRNIRGYLAGGMSAWHSAQLPIETTLAVDVPTLAEQLRGREVTLLDVRSEAEWRQGHVEDAIHVPYQQLRDGVPENVRAHDGEQPLAVACSGGIRSTIAASMLMRAGFKNIEHVADGGVPGLAREGIELVRESPDSH